MRTTDAPSLQHGQTSRKRPPKMQRLSGRLREGLREVVAYKNRTTGVPFREVAWAHLLLWKIIFCMQFLSYATCSAMLCTCQRFLRYKREIFILGVLGFLKTTRSFPKKSEVFRRRPKSAKGEVIEKTLIHKIRDREEGILIYSFYTWFSFVTWV